MTSPLNSDTFIYSCPEEDLWTPEERKTETKRLCDTCRKVVEAFAIRVYDINLVYNFCSKACYDAACE